MGKENNPFAAAMKEQWIVTKVGVESKDAYYAEIAKEVAEYRRSRSTTQVGIILYYHDDREEDAPWPKLSPNLYYR